MYHGVMHQGGYDANVAALVPGRRTWHDGTAERPLPPWSDRVDGIRFGVLQRGRRLLIARLEFGDQDVILHHVVPLDTMRHLGGGRRPVAGAGGEVVTIGDEQAERMLDDILAANPAQTNVVALLVNRVNQVRRAAREAAARHSAG